MRVVLAVLFALSSAWATPQVKTYRVRGEWECRMGQAWIGQDNWNGAYPAYVFFRPGRMPFPSIYVEKFSSGNGLYPHPGDFVRHFSRLPGGLRRAGQVKVSGNALMIWERSVQEKPTTLDSPGIVPAVVLEHIVVLEGKKAFLVLRWRASPQDAKTLEPEFQDFLSSFQLLGKK